MSLVGHVRPLRVPSVGATRLQRARCPKLLFHHCCCAPISGWGRAAHRPDVTPPTALCQRFTPLCLSCAFSLSSSYYCVSLQDTGSVLCPVHMSGMQPPPPGGAAAAAAASAAALASAPSRSSARSRKAAEERRGRSTSAEPPPLGGAGSRCGTATSTSFLTVSRALLSSMPPNTHRMLCSTSCLC